PTASTSTLSLRDALPICALDRRDARLVPAHLPGRGGEAEAARLGRGVQLPELPARGLQDGADRERTPGELRRALPRAARRGVSPDRKSTRLNSSHDQTSY